MRRSFFLFLFPKHLDLRVSFSYGELSGLASVTTSFALTQTSLLIGNFPLTSISDNTRLLVRLVLSSFLRSIGS
jgi:hypothetical protein